MVCINLGDSSFFFRKCRKTVQRNLDEAPVQLRKYKALAILLRIKDDMAVIALPAGKFVVILPACYALYAVVRIGGIIALFAGVYAIDTILVLEVILNLNAQVWIGSWNLKEEMMKCVGNRNSVLAKQVRGTNILKVSLGHLYFVDKGLVLTVLAIIVQNSINVLLLNSTSAW